LDRVISESVFKVLKKATKIAWHIDIGGGALLIRFFSLDSNYQRESHFVQARKLGSHSAKAMFAGFLRSLTTPTKVLAQSDVLTVEEVCRKTVVWGPQAGQRTKTARESVKS